MKTLELFAVFVIFIALVGCSTGYHITYDSKPIGASVICKGDNKGYTPLTLIFMPDENDRKRGIMKTEPCEAIWMSGARADYNTDWNIKKNPKQSKQTVERPNIKGYDQDVEFALKVQTMREQKRLADAKEALAREQALENLHNSMNRRRYGENRGRNCRYNKILNTKICN